MKKLYLCFFILLAPSYLYADEGVWGTGGAANWNKYKAYGENIPRVPAHTGSISLDLTPDPFSFFVTGRYAYSGELYIEYFQDDEVLKEIKKTDPFWSLDMQVVYKFENERGQLFAGVKNLNNEVQDDKRPDNAAFMWAPYTGRKFYGGGRMRF